MCPDHTLSMEREREGANCIAESSRHGALAIAQFNHWGVCMTWPHPVRGNRGRCQPQPIRALLAELGGVHAPEPVYVSGGAAYGVRSVFADLGGHVGPPAAVLSSVRPRTLLQRVDLHLGTNWNTHNRRIREYLQNWNTHNRRIREY